MDEAAAKIGKGVTGVQGGVAIQADLTRLFDQIKREHGKLDIVFANAGAAEFAPFGHLDEGHFDRMFHGNVKGLLFSVQTVIPLIPDGGSIILDSSVVGSKGFSANTGYAATKAAVRSFVRTWTTDLKERKIRVNVVSPGPVDTEGLNDLLASDEVGEQRRAGFTSLVSAVKSTSWQQKQKRGQQRSRRNRIPSLLVSTKRLPRARASESGAAAMCFYTSPPNSRIV